MSTPSTAGLVVRNVRFVDGTEGSSPRENPAFIHGWGDTASGLSCQSGWPTGFSTQLSVGANMVESTSSLAFKDTECTRNDTNWSTWQGSLGMDAAAAVSTRTTASALVGSGPTTGLPTGDTRRTLRGHLYR